MTYRIEGLAPGEGFLLPDCGKRGTVVRHSPGGTTVRYGDSKTVTLPSGVTFQRREEPVVISNGTMVERERVTLTEADLHTAGIL